MPNGYQAACLANASAYVKGDIRSVAVGSVLASRRLIGETRFPVGWLMTRTRCFGRG